MSDEYLSKDIIDIIPTLKIYAVTLVKERALAEDLVQDTLERAWRHRAAVGDGVSLKPWLFAILRNRAIDEFRRTRRSEAYDPEDGRCLGAVQPDQHWRVQERELWAFIQTLPAGTREALHLVIVDGLSHEEASQILGCPLGTLKSRIRRAKARLSAIVDVEPARAGRSDR